MSHSLLSRSLLGCVSTAILLTLSPAAAGALAIGSTEFPLGELAFPNAADCPGPGPCGGEVVVVDALYDPIAPAQALLGHTLDLVAVDLGAESAIALRFPIPLRDQDGPDLYLAQAQFLGDLAGVATCGDAGPGDVDAAEIRLAGDTAWHTIPCSDFHEDAAAGVSYVYYADPEIRTDAHRLWIVTLDLGALGVAPGAGVDGFDLRGDGFDAVLAGSLNAPEPGSLVLTASSLAGVAAFRSRTRRRISAREAA